MIRCPGRRWPTFIGVMLGLALLPTPRADADGTDALTAASSAAVFPGTGLSVGSGPVITGRLVDGEGVPVVGAEISAASRNAQGMVDPASVVAVTSDDGTYAFTPTPDGLPGKPVYSLIYTVSAAGAAAVGVPIGVRPDMTGIHPAQLRPPVGFRGLTVGGQIGGPVGSTVVTQVPDGHGGWRITARARTIARRPTMSYDAGVGYSFAHLAAPSPGRGTAVFRVVRPADRYYAEGDSEPFSVRFGRPPVGSARSYILGTPASPGRWPRFDGCIPITWAITAHGAPAGAVTMLKEVFRRVHLANGDTFRYVGTTTTVPTYDDAANRFGSGRGPDVIIAWEVRRELDATFGAPPGELGFGGSVVGASDGRGARLGGGFAVLVTGADSPTFSDFSDEGWGGPAMHEIGHVLGLRHTRDTTQVMFPYAGFTEAAYGAGDIAGLRHLGRAAGCGTR